MLLGCWVCASLLPGALAKFLARSYSNLRELFCDRNPGDARVKVGSERKVASSHSRQIPPNSGVAEIACFKSGLCAEGPSKIGLLIGMFIPKKIPIGS